MKRWRWLGWVFLRGFLENHREFVAIFFEGNWFWLGFRGFQVDGKWTAINLFSRGVGRVAVCFVGFFGVVSLRRRCSENCFVQMFGTDGFVFGLDPKNGWFRNVAVKSEMLVKNIYLYIFPWKWPFFHLMYVIIHTWSIWEWFKCVEATFYFKKWILTKTKHGWWFQISFVFTLPGGDDPIWLINIFEMGLLNLSSLGKWWPHVFLAFSQHSHPPLTPIQRRQFYVRTLTLTTWVRQRAGVSYHQKNEWRLPLPTGVFVAV